MLHKKVKKFMKDPKKALVKLSIPIFISLIAQSLYNIIDTAFVGRIGADAIAALTFAFPLFFVLIAFNSGIAAGMGSRISRMIGAKDKKEAENTAMHGLFISIVAAFVLLIAGLFTLKPLFILFGAEQRVLQLSLDYMTIVMYGIFFMFISTTINNIFSAQGDTRTPAKVQVCGLVLNAILDPIFIYTLGYGVKGAAIATVISLFVTMCLFIYYLKKKSHLKIELRYIRFSMATIKDIIYVGSSATFMTLLVSVYVIFINRFMAHFGVDYVASFGMASRLESIAIMPIIAFSISLLTLTGMFHGAKRYDLLRSITWYGIKLVVMITSAVGLVFFIFPKVFLFVFTSDKTLISIASSYLRIDVITFPLMGIGMMISRTMQGMGYGLPGLIINAVRIFVVALPLAYLFVYVMGFGYLSIAVAMVLGGLASSILGIIWLEIEMKKCNGRA